MIKLYWYLAILNTSATIPVEAPDFDSMNSHQAYANTFAQGL